MFMLRLVSVNPAPVLWRTPVLQAGGQRREALAAQHHLAVLLTGEGQAVYRVLGKPAAPA